MFKVEVHQIINHIISLFYRLGLWHRGDKATIKETRVKLFYLICIFFLPLSFMSEAFTTVNKDERIFLIEATLMTVVTSVKLMFIIWNKEIILDLLQRICVHSIEDEEEFNFVNKQLNRLMKFVALFIFVMIFSIISGTLIVPLIGSEKRLFVNIGFPLNYHNNDFAFWMAYTFFFTESTLAGMSILFSVIIWYLMISCALKYKVLGRQLIKMGLTTTVETAENKRKISNEEKNNCFLRDLISGIMSHQEIKESTHELESFISNVAFLQLATSAICICGSIYSLAFNKLNFLEYICYFGILFYNIFDIFVVMYLGDEIKASSDGLSYSLFESNWTSQPFSTKKNIIIFTELLQQPYVLIVGKIYPLTLETFMRIINGAYSMFNILQNLNLH